MPHPCVVCGRSRMNPKNRAEEYIFFGFPVSDEPRCKKWLEFCCREELYKLSKKQLLQRMICCKHFQLTDFVDNHKDRLSSSAVPSIYDPKQSLYNVGCVLCGRFRKDPPGPENNGETFHHFPGEEFRCLEWLDFVGVESYYRLTRKEIMYCYICSKHFDTTQFVPGFCNRLIETAVPNIKNPDDNEKNTERLEFDIISEVNLFDSTEKDEETGNPLPLNALESQACAACGRLKSDPRNKEENIKFHPFPAYEIGRCLKWCKFLEREDILKMSPNQIRKLVLCSSHFQSEQSFINGSGCDAVPTIWNSNYTQRLCKENDFMTHEQGSKILRPAISSKKPKVNSLNHPTPLAKKRGKSKRSTSIKIPKIDIRPSEPYFTHKLPIPSVNNWKLMANKFQPITLSNSLNNVVNAVSPVKKVIVPFSGDISKLGDPIPVDSLANIPPGLLIKIDLPEQEKGSDQSQKKKIKKEIQVKGSQQHNLMTAKHMQHLQFNVAQSFYCDNKDLNFVKCETVSQELINNKLQNKNYSFESNDSEEIESVMEIGDNIIFEEIKEVKSLKPKVKMSARCRKTLMPIQSELRKFIKKLKPHVSRLPNKSKAQVKLAIVNMVIDQL